MLPKPVGAKEDTRRIPREYAPDRWGGTSDNVQADTSTIVAEETKANLTVRFGKFLSSFNMPAVVRATTFQDGSPVIAEAKLELVNDRKTGVHETGLASIRKSVGDGRPNRAVKSSP